MHKEDKILITGGTGLIGKNLTSQLISNNFDVLSIGSEVDLRDQTQCENLFEDYKPSIVFHLAAKVGGFLQTQIINLHFILIMFSLIQMLLMHQVL